MPRHEPQNYRADIDGLRAIAVLAVVGFHAGVRGLGGGFAGVDVFFVISGYLITGIILRQLETGNFSFADFYARRANRILPALVLVLVSVLVAGWIVLFPDEYGNLGTHVVGGSTFTSNFILWGETSYFDSAEKPLPHLWSLGVEEQFYLAWPLLVWLAWKKRPMVGVVVLGLIAASFLVNAWWLQSGRWIGAFYSPFTRFWEIMAGAFLADMESRRRLKGRRLESDNPVTRNALSITGVALLATAFVVASNTSSWPGWRQVLPVAGSLCLLAAGRTPFLSRHLLSNRALVWIGLISYPLYLWHWPVIVFAKLVNGGALSWKGMLVVIIAVFVLAIATYRVIEIPIRFGAHKRRSALILLPVLALVGLTGFVVQLKIVQPRVNGTAANRIQQALSDWTYPGARGLSPVGKSVVINRIPGDSTRRVVFIGDSHAEQYWPRMVELARESPGAAPEVLFITYGGCSPFPNTERPGISWHGGPFNCPEFFRRAMAEIDREKAVTVVFASWWEVNLGTGRYIVSGRVPIGRADSAAKQAFSMLGDVIGDLTRSGKQVFLVASNPWSEAFNPKTLLPGRLPSFRDKHPILSLPRKQLEVESEFSNSQLRAIAGRTGAIVLDPFPVVCDSTTCPTVDTAGQPIYRDYNHMRATFVRRKATFIDVVETR